MTWEWAQSFPGLHLPPPTTCSALHTGHVIPPSCPTPVGLTLDLPATSLHTLPVQGTHLPSRPQLSGTHAHVHRKQGAQNPLGAAERAFVVTAGGQLGISGPPRGPAGLCSQHVWVAC